MRHADWWLVHETERTCSQRFTTPRRSNSRNVSCNSFFASVAFTTYQKSADDWRVVRSTVTFQPGAGNQSPWPGSYAEKGMSRPPPLEEKRTTRAGDPATAFRSHATRPALPCPALAPHLEHLELVESRFSSTHGLFIIFGCLVDLKQKLLRYGLSLRGAQLLSFAPLHGEKNLRVSRPRERREAGRQAPKRSTNQQRRQKRYYSGNSLIEIDQKQAESTLSPATTGS